MRRPLVEGEAREITKQKIAKALDYLSAKARQPPDDIVSDDDDSRALLAEHTSARRRSGTSKHWRKIALRNFSKQQPQRVGLIVSIRPATKNVCMSCVDVSKRSTRTRSPRPPRQ